jgi:hypothetical protein
MRGAGPGGGARLGKRLACCAVAISQKNRGHIARLRFRIVRSFIAYFLRNLIALGQVIEKDSSAHSH